MLKIKNIKTIYRVSKTTHPNPVQIEVHRVARA